MMRKYSGAAALDWAILPSEAGSCSDFGSTSSSLFHHSLTQNIWGCTGKMAQIFLASESHENWGSYQDGVH
jgi:hypothetical protein